MPMIDPKLCLKCKGARNLCGLGYCPWLRDIESKFKITQPIKGREIYGPSPNIFVGRYGYPDVNIGPLIFTGQYSDEVDLSERWFGRELDDIIAMRSLLYRGMKRVNVRARDRMLDTTREISLSSRAVDVEMVLEKPPPKVVTPRLDTFIQPMGPAVVPRRIDVVSNPVVPRRVDALVSDTDARATDAIYELYGSVPIEHIQRLVSAGLLGVEERRRLVPTRWAITAVDDTLGKALMEKVRYHQQLGEVQLYHSKYIGNSIWVLLIPDIWSFEMIETWRQGAFWAKETAIIQDYEGHYGRKTYASNVTGAYYAARLAVLEALDRMGRQATAIVYREITEEYVVPLGVWVIRETTRDAMKKKPLVFSSPLEAARYVAERVRTKDWYRSSVFLNRKRQSTLDEWTGGGL